MYIIDRFEGDMAVCEDEGVMINIPIRALPFGCKEGDCIEEERGEYRICMSERERRMEEMRAKRKKLGAATKTVHKEDKFI